MEKTDIAIIGAGVIGLAVSYSLKNFGKDVVVIEKNQSFGQETSSRNSEVIHAGLYYPKDSLKAKTCLTGRKLLYDFCRKNKIPHKKLGKIVVASQKKDFTKLEEIYKNAAECGVKDIKIIDEKEIKKLEPNINGRRAIFSPDTGIVDSHSLMNTLFVGAKENNVDFVFSVEVIKIEKHPHFYKIIVKEPNGDTFSFQSKCVINCAGLWSDKIAESVGIDIDKASYRMYYNKGQYFRIANPKKFSINHLIYPPPTKSDLGIHVTPDLAGGLRLGPDAQYVKNIEYSIREESKTDFLECVQKFLPQLKLNDIIPDTAGIRPKLQGESDTFRDFVIQEEKEKGFPGFINLIGIESPGLTSALSIAEIAKNMVNKLL